MTGIELHPSTFLAHGPNEQGIVDPLRSHLEKVAARAALNASAFDAADEA